jgi:hypothetical protein
VTRPDIEPKHSESGEPIVWCDVANLKSIAFSSRVPSGSPVALKDGRHLMLSRGYRTHAERMPGKFL